mmetsp:Transcript_56311/g.174725  ORF Transcript_56311/g.174725 Transcript_56311/m.174725 type:complete len:495 (-) Transcript_56311:130-1614(-)
MPEPARRAAGPLMAALMLAFVGLPGAEARCAWPHEDCSHTGCCMVRGMRCFKKNAWWASCLHTCHKGIHNDDPPEHRQPWACTPITKDAPDCAGKGEECAHLGCCSEPGKRCFSKDAHWSGCLKTCRRGQRNDDGSNMGSGPWTCNRVVTHESTHDGDEWAEDNGHSQEEEAQEIRREAEGTKGGEDLSKHWRQGLQATHFWDCNGGSCDASQLRPWSIWQYKYAPHYAPTDPHKHGGPLYGEKLWLTGAASDSLAQMLGPDTDCCGRDGGGGGGCGQCLLVKAKESDHPDWTAVIMKKNRCPPHSYGCDKVHMDVAVPGFDHLQYSTANICGSHTRSDTYISRHQSAICGATAPKHCDCGQLPDDTKERRQIKDGCLLFKRWGWHHGTPKLDYRPVPCPQNFVNWVKYGNAFNAQGVMSLSQAWNTSSESPTIGRMRRAPPGQKPNLARVATLLGSAAASMVLAGAALRLRRRGRAGATLLAAVEKEECKTEE